MNGTELEDKYIEKLRFLYRDNGEPKSILELNNPINTITKRDIEVINSTILTAAAASFIENNPNSSPKAFVLIEQDEHGTCRITDSGRKYVEYYDTYIRRILML